MDHLGVGLPQNALFIVPGSTLEEESIEVATSLWGRGPGRSLVCKLKHFVGEVNLIDRMLVASSEVLSDTSQERLREVEA